jgi:hypothetical protein
MASECVLATEIFTGLYPVKQGCETNNLCTDWALHCGLAGHALFLCPFLCTVLLLFHDMKLTLFLVMVC